MEIVTATSLAQGAIPAAPLLSDAFARLSACGLIVDIGGGYTLSADAQAMLANRRKNDDNEKALSLIMEHLAKYPCKGDHPSIQVGEEQLRDAVKASRAASIGPVKSLLASKPRPKPVWISKKDLVQGKQQLPQHKRRKP